MLSGKSRIYLTSDFSIVIHMIFHILSSAWYGHHKKNLADFIVAQIKNDVYGLTKIYHFFHNCLTNL